jgi:hypothetical protein
MNTTIKLLGLLFFVSSPGALRLAAAPGDSDGCCATSACNMAMSNPSSTPAGADAMAMKGGMKTEILSSYVKVSSALAADDLAAAKNAASEVVGHAGMAGNKDLAAKASAVANAAKIDEARDAFKALSSAVEPLAKGEQDYVAMHCPMAGDWVQMKGPTRNPYMGKAMLTCGGPKASK